MISKHTATVSTSLVHVLLKYAALSGGDARAICERVGLDPSALNEAQARIDLTLFDALWTEIARSLSDPDFGLHLAEWSRQAVGGGDVLSAVMMNSRTIGDAMRKLARYHDLATDGVRLELVQQGELFLYAWYPTHADMPPNRHYAEAILGMLVISLRNLTENQMQFHEIRFRHRRPKDLSLHQRILGAPLAFEQPRNELVIRSQEIERPIFLANPALLERLEQFAQEQLADLYSPHTWADRVVQIIAKMLLGGDKPAINTIAYELAISARQLQNKLKQEGVTYRALLDQVRKEIALGYLNKPGATICDIAFLLGFSEQSAFNHAFKRWTGSTPREYQPKERSH